ncbi:uncharacterized protein LOC129968421 [Argiope bruennichi]|uniref:uncharacterized protein LOC129968421 n=1 Tax=Argiope bruennichi TaxID=94029 RepID=UPI0024956E27|nr:uncharacterized protein LOC129968421 [Argiope bruennichi]
MSITKFKKEELKAIAEELKLPIPDNAKVLDLRELIQENARNLKDKDAVRFLVANSENDVQVYRFNRVPFGVNSSPFLLAATIKTHIEKYKEQYPVTGRALDSCFYVDDLVSGEDDVSSAFDLSNTAAKIMDDAGMNLRKWISNDCDLMKQWQTEHFDHLNINDFVNQPHRVLGLSWSPQNDYVSLNLKGLLDLILKRKNTKRFLLMAAGRIFDPMGFVSPFTIRFKILFQEIWQSKTDWDEELLLDVNEKFEQWCSEVSFLASKCRVAPLKPLSLPRLELMGALLAARLAKEVSRVLSEKIPATNHFWTDSTIALSWIQGSSSRWKVFVANRMKEIQSFTNKDTWHHCPGKDNPSDLLTRGISADSLLNCEKWWNGPSFLHEENIVPKNDDVILSDDSVCQEELKSSERKTLAVTLDNSFLNKILSIEGILNSRPLYPLSCDPNDFDVLTPGHFLVGRPISAIVEQSLTELPDNSNLWYGETNCISSTVELFFCL